MVNSLKAIALALVLLLIAIDPGRAQCTGQPNANTVCAGPATGGAGLPGFRALTPADVPAAGGVTIDSGGTPITGATAGQILYNAAGFVNGFVVGGDCTFTAPNFTCTKTGGVNFAPSATTDTRNATNINSGTLASARLATGFVVAGNGLSGGSVAGGGTIAADFATAAQFMSATANKILPADQVFTAEVPITFSATPTFNFNTFINASITLTGNITAITASNIKAGQAGMLRFIQDGTGGRTIPTTLSGSFHCPGGCNYVLSTPAASVDVIPYVCVSTAYCIGGPLIKDVK
jgi:hypothetical protein